MASDRRAYVRIPDAILREPWDDATLADLVRLQAYLNTRWARDHLTAEEAGRAFLGPQEMMLITRTSNITRARRRLLALPERSAGVTLTVVEATSGRRRGDVEASQGRYKGVIVDWPKFHIEQGYKDRGVPQSRGNLGVSQPLPHPRPDTATAKKEGAAVAAPLAGSVPERNRKKKRAQQTPFPEPFPPDLRAELQRWAEKNSFTLAQVDLAIQTVADWAVSNDRRKASWVRTIQGAMREGWALNRKPGTPVKEEATRREYLIFGSPEWEKAYGYKH